MKVLFTKLTEIFKSTPQEIDIISSKELNNLFRCAVKNLNIPDHEDYDSLTENIVHLLQTSLQ